MWSDLTMLQRGGVMGLAMQNGVYDINEIKQLYDQSHQLQQGGKFREAAQRRRGKDDYYLNKMEEVARKNWKNWDFKSEEEALIHALNDNTYDYRGYYAESPERNTDAEAHWPDTYKTVYHPTFSNESKYSGVIDKNYNPEGLVGGYWDEDDFVPADWQVGNEFSKGGGIHIKPSHRGRLTELKRRTGKTEAELWKTGGPKVRRMITFARNSRKWKHQDGGDIPMSEFGLWQYPNQVVDVPSNRITMRGIDYPVLGVSDTGDRKVMLPNAEYLFDGNMVREFPLQYQSGGKQIIATPEQEQQAKMRYAGYFDAMVNNGINPVHARNAAYYATQQSFAESGWKPNSRHNYGGMKNSKGVISYPSDEAYFDAWVKNANNRWPGYEKSKSIEDWDEALNHTSLGLFDKESFNAYAKKNLGTYIYAPAWDNNGYLKQMQGVGKRTSAALGDYPDTYFGDYVYNLDPLNTWQPPTTNQLVQKYQYGGLLKPFSYYDIPVVRYGDGGNLFQIGSYMMPQDDLKKTFGPIRAPQSWYEQNKQITVPALESKKPQPLQPIGDAYGSKYSELIPMSDGVYANNPINKGLQQDWRTFSTEIALPFAIAAGPVIGSSAAQLASKPALYNLGKMVLGSEIGGKGVDFASRYATGNTWGQNVGNVVEGVTGWNPNNTIIGQFVTESTNPGYFGLNKIGGRHIRQNDILDIFGSEYLKPEDFPSVNILKSQKPKLDVENYLNKHRQRIIDKFGEDAYNKVGQFMYGPGDEANIKKAIRLAIWDEYHDPIKALNRNLINQAYNRQRLEPAFNVGKRAVVVNPIAYKKKHPEMFNLYSDDIVWDLSRSHEMDHIFNWYKHMKKEDLATNGLFDLSKMNREDVKKYFSRRNNTELSARGSQLKDYFGSNTITGDQLRYAAKNYIKDIGLDNDMTDFFNGITDWDGMAKWISKNSTAIASPFLIGSFLNSERHGDEHNEKYY